MGCGRLDRTAPGRSLTTCWLSYGWSVTTTPRGDRLSGNPKSRLAEWVPFFERKCLLDTPQSHPQCAADTIPRMCFLPGRWPFKVGFSLVFAKLASQEFDLPFVLANWVYNEVWLLVCTRQVDLMLRRQSSCLGSWNPLARSLSETDGELDSFFGLAEWASAILP